MSGTSNGAFAPDAFGLQLDYFSGDYTRSNTNIATLNGASNALYSGQIQTQSWFTKKPQSVVSTQGAQLNNPVAYTYIYDQKYQLQEATFGTPDFTSLAFYGKYCSVCPHLGDCFWFCSLFS